ncbi:DUF362 domain-containing protein [Candidatus Bathyarchaeota archaeon]|nr:DUF362 domain-containing protein [Candidatus Bathyarchaeota archaeon]
MTAYLSEVAIVKGDEPSEMVVKALTLVGAEQAFKIEEKILIKPNYINASHPATGNTTDARVIEGIVKYFKEKGYNKITVGEGSGFADTMKAYEVAGINEVARRWQINLVDLNKDEYEAVDAQKSPVLSSVKISKTALNSAIISVPKLKLHRITGVTLSLKNMMGVVQPKGKMHFHLNEKISDLALIVKPRLAVIDGIVGGEGHETAGRPVPMNLVIAGLDPVAVDTVGVAVMGVDVNNVKHVKLASKKGLGVSDLNLIRILGEPIENVKRTFKPSFSSYFMSKFA